MQTVTLQFDDVYYQELINQVGKENLAEFFQKVSEPYLRLKQKSNSSDDELSQAHQQILSERLANYEKDGNQGKPYKTAILDIRAKLGQ